MTCYCCNMHCYSRTRANSGSYLPVAMNGDLSAHHWHSAIQYQHRSSYSSGKTHRVTCSKNICEDVNWICALLLLDSAAAISDDRTNSSLEFGHSLCKRAVLISAAARTIYSCSREVNKLVTDAYALVAAALTMMKVFKSLCNVLMHSRNHCS
jgi:hypothetical protein